MMPLCTLEFLKSERDVDVTIALLKIWSELPKTSVFQLQNQCVYFNKFQNFQTLN